MRYSYARTLAASFIFIVMTTLKLIFPGLAIEMREGVSELIDSNTDYRGVVTALGESITGPEGLRAVFKGPVDESAMPTSKLKLGFLNPLNWRIPLPGRKTADKKPPVQETTAPETEETATPIEKETSFPLAEETAAPGAEAAPLSENAAGSEFVTEPEFVETSAFAGQEPASPTPVTPSPTPTPTPKADTPENPVIAAFLERQSAYSDYAVPANVRYDMPELPFTYVKPVSGAKPEGFGYRVHPLEGTVKFHYGTDIPACSGDDISAFADGAVIFVGEDEGYGDYLILDHGHGFTTLYAHCSHIYVEPGQKVSAGDKIALAGATGKVTGPHLHFELKSGEYYLNPEFYLSEL